MKAIIVAGTTSGVGKTTVAVGIMGALRKRGLKVQPYKTGPDYIDPGYHTEITGSQSRNLDTWLLNKHTIINLFTRAMLGKDIAVIEGVMGLFDGRSSLGDDGSTAELAKLLGVPVLLVIDSHKGSRSLAAIVAGYQSFDPGLNICGVILNGIGSDWHLELCKEAIEHYTHIPVLGYLPHRNDLSLPERHLGLIPTGENPIAADFYDRLIAQCDATFDIYRILRLAEADIPHSEIVPAPNALKRNNIRIGIARDKAFTFYYQDGIDLFRAEGVEIIPFSPLQDECLPKDISGIYIGGGFPELYAEELSANQPMKNEISSSVRRGMPVYGECGGLMYLGKTIRDFDGIEYDMVGSLPVSSRIDSPKLSLGYRTVRARNDGPLLKQGETVRGHEFHWSVLHECSMSPNAYDILDTGGVREGFQIGELLASYIHLHFCSLPSMVKHFITKCENFQQLHRS